MYAYVHSHILPPKSGPEARIIQDSLQEEARSKRREARIQEVPAKVVEAVTHQMWRLHYLPMALWQEQEARTLQESPKPVLPNPAFSVCLLSLYSMSDSVTNSKSYSSDVIGWIDPVTIDSNICCDNNHNDYEEEFLKNPHPRRERLTTK